MERRVIAFCLIAAAMFMTMNLLSRNKNADEQKPDAEVAQNDDQPKGADADSKKAEIKPAEDEAEKVEEKQQPRKFVTLGSVDSDVADMLVTFDSRGGAVSRIELPADRFHSLEDRRLGGYFGWLMPFDAAAGCEIRIVGPGTPAAIATPKEASSGVGLQVGDIIKNLAGFEVVDVESYVDALKQTKAGDEIEVVVERKGADAVSLLTYTAKLTDTPLEVIKPEVSDVVDKVTGLSRTVEHPSAYLTSLARINGSVIPVEGKMVADMPLVEKNWRLVENEDPTIVQFETLVTPEDLPQGVRFARLRLVKTYQLPTRPVEGVADPNYKPYGLKYTLQVFNDGEEAVDAAFRQFGATGLPTEGWWYSNKISRGWGGAGLRDVVWEDSRGDYEMFTVANIVAKYEDLESDRQVSMFKVDEQVKAKFAGVDAVYFASAMVFDNPEKDPTLSRGAAFVAAAVSDVMKQKTDCTYRLDGSPTTIQPGDKPFEMSCTIFSGPKKSELLALYGLENLEYFGWFHYVSTALLGVLHFMHDYLYIPYGLGIIFLTLMVRSALFPLSRKQARNMLIQQQLAPEMKKISERYKDDPIKQRQAQQELFTKYNFNPLGGCGVMFLQLPIFLGLYRALAVDIQLRQAPFIPGIQWCSNLAAPDQFWYWVGVLPDFMTSIPSTSFPTSFLFLGPYLNLLPLVTIALFLVQQKMFMPPPTDEQQKMQQQMMTYMMVFIGFMFFRVPSGLCIYFITQSVWGIVERKLIPKPQLPDLSDTIESTATPKKPKKRPPGKK
ncbi:YidC/Oxa1 family insertase periplasmic-domain containing protein [Blastopirellula sp. JC732]|uniref:Membrane protein insertase YidC n=1 Tax=Blastopirellula sediminis TaxID=2894196 RepID=A0A9X1MI99_9BACT|nr:YidC/Oxa1 family insertase periplasmic-domain containing protein [Blastopirellula sediminis]MCC9609526.1 YidC/Oxa1 family insertase periplasmic-domain containing protein [Blastopirellula sediminis]MCC9627698.1 YidC/Oxa1 family insertase periplasmic-domain containing protein [Blastopirellula sediminis]